MHLFDILPAICPEKSWIFSVWRAVTLCICNQLCSQLLGLDFVWSRILTILLGMRCDFATWAQTVINSNLSRKSGSRVVDVLRVAAAVRLCLARLCRWQD